MYLSHLLRLGALASVVIGVAADEAPKLGDVLANHANLTTFNNLLRKFPSLLLELPSSGGVTIIAPSDQAFKNIPYTALNGVWNTDNEDITLNLLRYHVLQGTLDTTSVKSGPTFMKTSLLTSTKYTNVTAGQNVLFTVQSDKTVIFTSGLGNRCTVVDKDVAFQGGIIQVIDNLLIPPALLDKTAQAFQATSFLGALYAGKLMPGLEYRDGVTIFVPSDVAMSSVGGTLEKLSTSALSRVAGYHVVPGQVLNLENMANNTMLKTLGNSTQNDITVRQSGNNKYVNSAQIVQPDILLANGIMHIISDVLNPDSPAVPNPSQATQLPVFDPSKVDHPFTSALPCSTNCPVTDSTSATGSAASSATKTKGPSTTSSNGHGPRNTAQVGAAAALGGAIGLVLAL